MARALTAAGAVLVVLAGTTAMQPAPSAGQPAAQLSPGPATAGSFHQIYLPDLLVIEPSGLTTAQLGKLSAIAGVRAVIAADGAAIKLGGHQVTVLGVNPGQFRSWTPLATASDQRLWAALQRGQFVTSDTLARQLRLTAGRSYTMTGAAAQKLAFGGSAPLGVAGIDVLVSNQALVGLGLVRGVLAMISAPGASMASLTSAVRSIAGPKATAVSLRAQQQQPQQSPPQQQQQQQQLPVDAAAGSARPATYLQLFKESAADYCPGLSWTVLAAIGQIESGDGSNMGPSTAGALGPMQFLPSTWAEWGITAFGETGTPDIMDPYDAVPSAARLLCAAGGGTASGLRGAIFAYNHATWYVTEVLALASAYARDYG